jgi:hypothetical protein
MSTCQICAREIKAGDGLIAHHGYKRPGHGWQTASCMGAKFAPYEVSRDRLPAVVRVVTDYLTTTRKTLRELLKGPPATFTVQPRDAWGNKRGEPRVYACPVDFDPNDSIRLGSTMPGTYGGEFRKERRRLEDGIAAAVRDLKFFRARYEAQPEYAAAARRAS